MHRMLGQPTMSMPRACRYLHQFWTDTWLNGSSNYDFIGDWVRHRWRKIWSANRMRRFALCHRRVRMHAPAEIIDQLMRAHVFGLPLLILPSARMCVALSGVRARACARAGVYMWRPVPCRHRAHAWACAIPGNCAAGANVLCLRSSGFCCPLVLRMACAGACV